MKKKAVYFGVISSFLVLLTGLFCFVLLLITHFLSVAMERGGSWKNLLVIQIVIIWIIVIILIISAIFSTVLVIKPLGNMITELRSHERLSLKGAAELQELAQNYNRMRAKLMTESEKLSHEASHDALTGVYNRKVFENIRADEGMEDYALILIDIDDFKEFNDVYGHDVGDKVLQKMGRLLLSNFRTTDYPCRVGGDEFALIMIKTGRNLQELIENKLITLNEQMQDTGDNLPPATLSVGVAYSSECDDPYVEADVALYRSKALGKGHITFCEEKTGSE